MDQSWVWILAPNWIIRLLPYQDKVFKYSQQRSEKKQNKIWSNKSKIMETNTNLPNKVENPTVMISFRLKSTTKQNSKLPILNLWDVYRVTKTKHNLSVKCYRMLSLKLPLPDVLDWPPSASAADVRFHVWKSRRTWLRFSIQAILSCLVSAENQHLNKSSIYQYVRITGTLNYSE